MPQVFIFFIIVIEVFVFLVAGAILHKREKSFLPLFILMATAIVALTTYMLVDSVLILGPALFVGASAALFYQFYILRQN